MEILEATQFDLVYTGKTMAPSVVVKTPILSPSEIAARLGISAKTQKFLSNLVISGNLAKSSKKTATKRSTHSGTSRLTNSESAGEKPNAKKTGLRMNSRSNGTALKKTAPKKTAAKNRHARRTIAK